MADLYNNFPSWGESGEYPVDGFFYEGGDQVNEKHMDALWNGVKAHIDNLNTAIRDRVRKLQGNVVLDSGLVASQGSGTREIDVTASSAGAFVDGQFTGSTSATTLTHTANGGASTRTDVVWVNTNGSVGKTEGQTTVASDRMKLAEVDVATDDTISDVRNYARDHVLNIASENTPSGVKPGDLWQDLLDKREKVYQNGDWRTLITEQDDLTATAGDGLKGTQTVDLVGGASFTFNIEPADFAGDGVKDDGADNIAIEPSDFAGAGLSDDGSDNLQINAGNQLAISGDQLNVQESGLNADQVDGYEGADLILSTSEDGTTILTATADLNFGYGITAIDDGDGTATVETNDQEIETQTLMHNSGFAPNFGGA